MVPTWVDPTHTLSTNYGFSIGSHGQIFGSVNDVFSQSIVIENFTLPV